MFVDPALRSFNRRTNNLGTFHDQNNREDPSIPYVDVEYHQRWDARTGMPLDDLNVMSKIPKEVVDKGFPPPDFGIHLLLPDGSMFFGMGGRMVRIDPSGKPVWIRPEFKEGYEGYVFYTAFADGKIFVAYHTANSSGEDHEKWIQGLQAKAALSEDPDALEKMLHTAPPSLADSEHLICLDPKDGRILSSHPLPNGYGHVVSSDGTLLAFVIRGGEHGADRIEVLRLPGLELEYTLPAPPSLPDPVGSDCMFLDIGKTFVVATWNKSGQGVWVSLYDRTTGSHIRDIARYPNDALIGTRLDIPTSRLLTFRANGEGTIFKID